MMKISQAVALSLSFFCLLLPSCRSLNSNADNQVSAVNEIPASSSALIGEISCGRSRNYRTLYGAATKDTIELAIEGTFVGTALLDEKGEFVPQSGKLYFKLPNQVGPDGVLELKGSAGDRPSIWVENAEEGTGKPVYTEVRLHSLRATFKKIVGSPHTSVNFEYIQAYDPEKIEDVIDTFKQCDEEPKVVKVTFPEEIRSAK